MNQYYIVYKKKILHGPMSKSDAISKLFELSVTFKGLRVRSYFGKNNPDSLANPAEEMLDPAEIAAIKEPEESQEA